jgi:hypothetical protein
VGVEQGLVELASLMFVQLAQRWVADDLLDAAAQLGARHWRRDTAIAWDCPSITELVGFGVSVGVDGLAGLAFELKSDLLTLRPPFVPNPKATAPYAEPDPD